MRIVNTHLSDNCTRKCLVFVDRDGFYELSRFALVDGGWRYQKFGRTHFKHIESLQRAVKDWIGK